MVEERVVGLVAGELPDGHLPDSADIRLNNNNYNHLSRYKKKEEKLALQKMFGSR